VCSKNQWRSPTAEALYRKHPSLAVRSAGTSSSARHQLSGDYKYVDEELIDLLTTSVGSILGIDI
jgi:predicted protein tyrosine phosphatase